MLALSLLLGLVLLIGGLTWDVACVDEALDRIAGGTGPYMSGPGLCVSGAGLLLIMSSLPV